MRGLNYLPFSDGKGQTDVFKMQLPYQDLKTFINMTVGGATSLAKGDKFTKDANAQTALNAVGQFNPLIKAAASTVFGKSLYGGDDNDSNFIKALANEVGGVFTRIPEMIKKAIEEGKGTEDLSKMLRDLVGLTKSYEAGSIKQQRVYELIDYLEQEIQKTTKYTMAYARMKDRMFGATPKQQTYTKGKVIRTKKRKKKPLETYGDNKY